ncbi:MAG: GatB/YqeY domain-containing protein [Ardenticatenia bacterium]|nr:GatB/YqeY domain-containing protein [Ardenticatenia bacterium]
MSLKAQLQSDLKAAMKAGDTVKRNTVRLLLSAIHNAEIDKGGELTEQDVVVLLQKQAKQRRESIEQYRKAGRQDLVQEEAAELAVIESYLPRMLGEEEIRQEALAQIEAVGATGPKDMGKVMGPLMAKLRGRADGALVQRVVRELLARRGE